MSDTEKAYSGLGKLLSNVGWRNKILMFSALYLVLVMVIGGFGAVTIYKQNQSMQDMIETSQTRINVVTNARMSVVELGRSIASVIATTERKEIRMQAVSAIRALSLLDENVQILAETLKNSPEVQELSELIKRIRPFQMQVIKAAKKNEDELALLKSKEILHDTSRIDELSQQLLERERHLIVETQELSSKDGTRVITIMGVIIATGIAIGLLVSFIGVRLMTRPLGLVERTMTTVANGDLRVKLNCSGSDEIARTVTAIDKTVTTLHEIISNIRTRATNLHGASSDISDSAGGIVSASTKVHNFIEDIKGDTAVVLDVTSQVGQSLEDSVTSAQETSDASRNAANEIMGTVNEFQQFQSHMEQTAQTTRDLAAAAEKVTTFTDTIANISAQTNLLALNAAIEAARAGDHGRGFAVVADEVRMLAQRTDESTVEITSLVENISNSINETVTSLDKSVDDANGNIQRLIKLADEITHSSERANSNRELMQQVAGLTDSQTHAIDRINTVVNELFKISGDTNQQTDMLHGLSDSLGVAASELNQVVDRFQL